MGKPCSPCHQREAGTHTLRVEHQRVLPSGLPALQDAHPAEQTAGMLDWLQAVQFHLDTLGQMLWTAHPACLKWEKTLPSIKGLAE